MLILVLCLAACSSTSNNGVARLAPTTAPAVSPRASLATAAAAVPGTPTSTLPKTALNVAAASDLRNALMSMQSAIEVTCTTKLTFVFGSSGTLEQQILAGADYDLFLSADTGYIDELDKAGMLTPGGHANYAVGRLALAWRSGVSALTGVADLARDDIKQIAIANPAHAPYGRAAQQAMVAAKITDQVQSRLVLAENIRQATDYVEHGNADAGLVALALVLGTKDNYIVVDATLHQPIVQGGGVIKGRPNSQTAACALAYLRSADGQQTLKQYGFEPAPQ